MGADRDAPPIAASSSVVLSGLRVEADGPVRTVLLDRPDALNAVDKDMHRSLAQVWRQLASDPTARAVVLTGAGRAFCAGGDMGWLVAKLGNPVEEAESIREAAEIIDEMLRFPLPVVAAVNGPAVGLGCNIALLCDIVLIADDAYLADPHVPIGLAAGDGGAAFWPLLAPILRIREHLLTGERIPADQAVELGLASRVVPAGDLRAEAERLARRLAAQPPAALQATKRVLNMHLAQALAGPLPAGLAAETATMATDEYRQRLLARWEGRR